VLDSKLGVRPAYSPAGGGTGYDTGVGVEKKG
jgi:hypothetical protein